MGAVSDGPVRVSGLLRSADTLATVAATRALGVTVDEQPDGLVVHGSGWEGLAEPSDVIDVANSGTLIRLLPGLVAPLDMFCVLTGDASIRRRPMARIIEPLSQMGASVSGRAGNTLPPIAIRGGSLAPLNYQMRVASAQVKSCLMLAALRASGPSVIVEPAASRDHTERMIRYGGGRVVSKTLADGRVEHTVEPMERLQMGSLVIPGDFSSAAFLLVAALLIPGSEITVENVGLNPTRTALLDVLIRMGAEIEVRPTEMLGPEPVGRLTARSSSLHAVEVGAAEVPNIIDELPLFLLAAARAEGVSKLRGAAELRAKESDRLSAMAATLSGLGVSVKELPDGMDVEGTAASWRGGDVKAYGDHRIAMVGAVAGLLSREGTVVDDTACIGVSYPSFMDTIGQLGAEWTVAAR